MAKSLYRKSCSRPFILLQYKIYIKVWADEELKCPKIKCISKKSKNLNFIFILNIFSIKIGTFRNLENHELKHPLKCPKPSNSNFIKRFQQQRTLYNNDFD